MLSYQHGYHAGGLADVHKHTALALVLRHLLAKPSPFCMIDTHAGAGTYDLASEQAAKTGEWKDGIGRLVAGPKPKSAGLALYLDAIRAFNGPGALVRYPGSPMIALHAARACDRLVAMELHPAEHAALRAALQPFRNAHVHKRDGFVGLPALVPPLERRGLVLIDPSYEMKDDYARVPDVVARALKRWRAGIYMAWYPILPEGRHEILRAGFAAIAATGVPVLEAELLGPPRPRGLIGTGLAVVNPPHRFEDALAEAGAELAARLFSKDAGRHVCNTLAAPA